MNKHCHNLKCDWTAFKQHSRQTRVWNVKETKDFILIAGFRVSVIPLGAIAKANPRFVK